MESFLERLLRTVVPPDPEKAETLWWEYRRGGAEGNVALATLLTWYGNPLYRRIWGFVRTDTAEDVLQDVLAELHRNRTKLATFADAQRWLRAVATAKAVDTNRRTARRRVRERRAARPESDPAPARPDELQEAVCAGLAKLPAEEREAVALVFFEGLTRREAAVVAGIGRATLAARLDAALKRLQQLVPAPAAVMAAVALPTALAAGPPLLAPARLGEIVAGALAAGSGRGVAGWLVFAIGFVVCGGAAAGWVAILQPRPDDAPQAIAPQNATETLQAKNLRIFQEEVLPKLLSECARTLPADNPVRVTSVRAFGSEVEVELRPARPVPNFFPAGLRLRYCVVRREMSASADSGNGKWSGIDSARPIVVGIPHPLAPIVVIPVIAGRDRWAWARSTFALIPPDPRGEAELIRLHFDPKSPDLRFPTGAHLSVFVGGWIGQVDRALLIRDPDRRWRYSGECPGWYPVVAEGRVYCSGHDMIRTRPLADPAAAWEKWCDEPPVGWGERPQQLFVSNGRLYQAVHPYKLWSRPLGDRASGWTLDEHPFPYYSTALAATSDRVYVHDESNLYVRHAADPTKAWSKAGPWPTACVALVADGDRLLAYGESGPIHARPITAAPDTPWTIVGRVHDPYER